MKMDIIFIIGTSMAMMEILNNIHYYTPKVLHWRSARMCKVEIIHTSFFAVKTRLWCVYVRVHDLEIHFSIF